MRLLSRPSPACKRAQRTSSSCTGRIDVKKIHAEVREMELENLRAAAGILSNKVGDPDVESVKKVIVSGNDVQPGLDVREVSEERNFNI